MNSISCRQGWSAKGLGLLSFMHEHDTHILCGALCPGSGTEDRGGSDKEMCLKDMSCKQREVQQWCQRSGYATVVKWISDWMCAV